MTLPRAAVNMQSAVLSTYIAIATLLVATIALVFQARGFRLKQRELQIKVEDMSAVIARIQAEEQRREALAEAHESLVIDSSSRYAHSLDHTGQLSEQLWTATRGHELIFSRHLSYLHRLVSVGAHLLGTGRLDDSDLSIFLRHTATTSSLAVVALARGLEYSEALAAVGHRAREGRGSGIDQRERLASLDTEIGRAHGLYQEKAVEAIASFTKAEGAFTEWMNQMVLADSASKTE